MNKSEFQFSVPILASLNTEETVKFYIDNLNFEIIHHAPQEYLIMKRDEISIHFWKCNTRYIAENTACRIQVTNINTLYEDCTSHGIVHPNGQIKDMEWGNREFAVLDSHGNLITFYEELETNT